MIVLPLIIGMNLIEFYSESTYESLSIFKGKHTDFGGPWYQDIGYQIVVVMIVFAFQPIIDFCTEWLTLRIYRCYYRQTVYNKSK